MNMWFAQVREKIVDVRPNELRALALAFIFNFVILGSYYVIRPIRDDIGAAGGLENLSWLFTATLVGMLIANALFSAIVARMSRRRFIPIAYRFFIANLIAFYLAMRLLPAAQQPGRNRWRAHYRRIDKANRRAEFALFFRGLTRGRRTMRPILPSRFQTLA